VGRGAFWRYSHAQLNAVQKQWNQFEELAIRGGRVGCEELVQIEARDLHYRPRPRVVHPLFGVYTAWPEHGAPNEMVGARQP